MQAFVGLFQVYILAHDGDRDLAVRIVAVADEFFPRIKLGIACGQAQHDGHFLIKAFRIKLERHFIDIVHVYRREHGILIHIAEQGDLAAQFFRNALFTAAEDDIGLNADGEQFLYAVLGGLGLVLAGAAQVGNQGKMDVQAVVAPKFGAQLAYGLKKGQAFNIAHGAAYFNDGDVRGVFAFGQGENHAFDFIRNMGDDLYRGSQVVTVTFLGDNLVIDGP